MDQPRRQFLRNLLAGAAGGALSLGTFSRADAEESPDWRTSLREAASEDDFWDKVKAQFRPPEGKLWFNSGTLGLMPDPVVTAMHATLAALQIGNYVTLKEIRGEVARSIGAQEIELAFTHNTTSGINIFAHGINLRAGD